MIEDIPIIGFVDFAICIANQDVVFAHVGPVGPCIRCRQVTQLILFDGVFGRLILRRCGIADFELSEISDELLFLIGFDA